MIWKLLRLILFRFNPETAHRITVCLLKMVIAVDRHLGFMILRSISGFRSASRPVSALEMDFLSPIGLAAGLDKNAEIIEGLPALGFGFAEIGTVTPRPQLGNPKPRVFRDLKQLAIFNRMGFNSDGAEEVARRLAKVRSKLPKNFRIGVNVGKNASTPLENAAHDYALAVQPFQGLSDYLVLNVSSPNTPGLRSLQTADALQPLIDEVNKIISSWSPKPPLLLKLAPEIEGETLGQIIKMGESRGIDGWILTNTLGGAWKNNENGGWSGAPLTSLSERRLREVRSLTRLPVISVGGIMTSDDARKRFQIGANLIQIYTGWIYNGPKFVNEIQLI
jgi:dihydroorotate dehydrogenase